MLSERDIIGNFGIEEIIKKFPQSGQKQVVLVRHRTYGQVVLKIVEGQSERVVREIQIVTENQFPNVPKVLEVDTYSIDSRQGIYLLEEYIEGIGLKEMVAGKMNLSEAMDLTEQLLRVIVEMEKRQIVHRDIKPENIIRANDGRWCLIDFGIARALNKNSLTYTEAKMGPHTPGYGAPELFQYAKHDIDSRADLFSLGVVVFEAVTGKHPFIRGDEMDLNEVWYNTVTITPQSVVVEGDVDMQFMGLLQTFMQKHVTRRPETAQKAYEWFESVKSYIEG
ncbi:serine/threonine-protein kinase [Lachnospiraceae bacterium 48-42]|jgi:Serine/threonine protein kinase